MGNERLLALVWALVCAVVLCAACSDAARSADAGPDAAITSDAGAPDAGDAGAPGAISVPHREGCADLIGEVCIYPYPSMTHLKADAQSSTGYRVAITRAMLPFGEEAPGSLDAFLARFNEADGFSIATPLLAIFPSVHVDEATLPSIDALAASVTEGSGVQVLDRTDGARVPVWAEMDDYARDKTSGAWKDSRRTMMIRPQAALEWNRRYAVVVTDAVKDGAGMPLPRPPAMAALATGAKTDNPQVEALRPAYDELFAFLEGRGVPRARVVLAWEFHTMSRAFAEGPLTRVLEAGRARASSFTFDRTCLSTDPADPAQGCGVGEKLSARAWRRLEGRFRTPSFIGPDGTIAWEDGAPVPRSDEGVFFAAVVPQSAKGAAAGSVPLLQIGHGLLSSQSRYLPPEGDENGVIALSDKAGAIAVGADFRALCTADLGVPMAMVGDISRMWAFHDQLLQGMLNWDLVVSFARAALAADPALAGADGSPLLDPARAHFYGISLGGIAGAVAMAASREVKTAAFNVPSAVFSSLLQHSYEFLPFQQILAMYHTNPVDQQILLALAQRALDPIDPINWRARFFDEPLTPLGRKNLLWQVAFNDTNAPDFGAFALMRSTGIPLVLPTTHEPYGVAATVQAPTAPGQSGLVLYDTGAAAPSYRNDDVPDNGAHFSLRCNDEVHRQVAGFFASGAEGTIALHCGGGACNIQGIECRTGAAEKPDGGQGDQ